MMTVGLLTGLKLLGTIVLASHRAFPEIEPAEIREALTRIGPRGQIGDTFVAFEYTASRVTRSTLPNWHPTGILYL